MTQSSTMRCVPNDNDQQLSKRVELMIDQVTFKYAVVVTLYHAAINPYDIK